MGACPEPVLTPQGALALSAAGCLFFTPQSVHQEDTAGPGEGEEVQQDLPVKRKLDLSSDEVETGGVGGLPLSEARTPVRLSKATCSPPSTGRCHLRQGCS